MQRAATRGAIVVSNGMPGTRTYTRTRPALSVNFIENHRQIEGYWTHLYTPLMLNRESTVDNDPKYNGTVGLSAGANVRAHLDFGTLSHLTSILMPNNSAHSIYSKLVPITPVEVGPGYVLGREKLVTRHNCSKVCWSCNGKEWLTISTYDDVGQLRSTESRVGPVNVTMVSNDVTIVSVSGGWNTEDDDGELVTVANVTPSESPLPETDWFSAAGHGVFTHFLNGLQNSWGRNSQGKNSSWDQMVSEFDVEAYAADAAATGAKYAFITIMQDDKWMIAPNARFDELTGYMPVRMIFFT